MKTLSFTLSKGAVGGAKVAVNAVGAYARIRKQFRVPIAEMGGVHEALVMWTIQFDFEIVNHDYNSLRVASHRRPSS